MFSVPKQYSLQSTGPCIMHPFQARFQSPCYIFHNIKYIRKSQTPYSSGKVVDPDTNGVLEKKKK